MQEGDDQASRADAESLASLRDLKQAVASAVQAYRNAAFARPDAAEPYFRIASVLYEFYFGCGLDRASPLCDVHGLSSKARAEETIAAWDAFEARAPLDPRVAEFLFARAILHTRLATPAHLEAAAADYQHILRRAESMPDSGLEEVYGNLGETHMMLGRLDEAIDAYREAVGRGGKISTVYGLAVALDRDDRGAQARDAILGLGREAVLKFKEDVGIGTTFFVPAGEVNYYYALIDESYGFDDAAIEAWDLYLKSGAHPQYQPRARAHRDALLKRRHPR
jgi:tetratricopeptide (TPR) repeat protein